MAKKDDWSISQILLFLIIGFFAVALLIPFQYESTERYTDTEPYTVYETYYETVPYTERECRTDIPDSMMDIGSRAIEALIDDDVSKLHETCETVTKFKEIEKQRPITKYKSVSKTRTVTKSATLFEQWKDS